MSARTLTWKGHVTFSFFLDFLFLEAIIWTSFASDFSWAVSEKCLGTSAILHYFAEPATTKYKPAAVLQLSSTLVTKLSSTLTNSHQLSLKFEPVQSRWELMRVYESWRSNASESCNSGQISSFFDQALPSCVRSFHWVKHETSIFLKVLTSWNNTCSNAKLHLC